MAVNRIEQKGGAPEAGGAKDAKPADGASAPSAPGSKGGSSWLPLILNLVLMPAIAYALTMFVIVPKLASGQQGGSSHGEKTSTSENSDKGGKEEPGAKTKMVVPLSQKIVVNLRESMGTRYLMAQISLVGKGETFKSLVEKNDLQLRDVAGTVLSAKTASDIEKPGSRNMIKAELMSSFNPVLGDNTVQEIFLTEFATQ